MSKNELKQLFKVATSLTDFLFTGSFYDQIGSVSIESPFGPVLENLFMGYHEQKLASGIWRMWFTFIQASCRWYVFACLKNEIDAEHFFKYLNSKHPNIKFTMEGDTNKILPSVDVPVKNECWTFTTSVYGKRMSVGIFT